MIADSGLPVHIFDKGRVKTKCGINTKKVSGISYVQHGFEFTGKKENLCKHCLSHYPQLMKDIEQPGKHNTDIAK